MKKNNNILGVLVVLLSIVVLGLTGFIVYDKVLSKEANGGNSEEIIKEDNADNDITIEDNNNLDYDAETIAKEKMPVAISLINQEKNASVYCGGFDNEDVIIIDKDTYVITMDASSKFKTLNELKNHLKDNLSDEIIKKYFKTKENLYLEKDGKLYCERGHKGFEWAFISNEDEINSVNPVEYLISNQQQNSFDVKVELKYGLLGGYEADQLVTINGTIAKENGIWLVNKYKQE